MGTYHEAQSICLIENWEAAVATQKGFALSFK